MLIRSPALAAPLSLIIACAAAIAPGPVAWAGPISPTTDVSGTFIPFRPGNKAITYDETVVPEGATARLIITNLPYGTSVHLTATGLVPNRAYGAHLHTRPCTAVPDEAGPHYQHHADPAPPPSVNPVYANPRNEVWLDFTADATGAGDSESTHGWDFSPTRPPRSLVIHAERTLTGPGEAGKAGARAACMTLPGA